MNKETIVTNDLTVYELQPILDCKTKRKKWEITGKKINFDYIPRKIFKKKKDIKVIGYFEKSFIFKGEKFLVIENLKRKEKQYFNIDEQKKSNRKIVGYVYVGNNEYIGFLRPYKPWWLLSLLLLLLIIPFNNQEQEKKPKPTINDLDNFDGTLDTGKNQQINDNIEFLGYSTQYINAETKVMQLGNLEKNTVYFEYYVYNEKTKELIFKTPLIKPGQAYNWEVKKDLDVGSHNINLEVKTYDTNDDLTPCTGIKIPNVNIIVSK